MANVTTHKVIPNEVWKKVNLKIATSKNYKLEVSNMGRLRSFNSINDGNILEGSLLNGYRIYRLKMFVPRTEATIAVIDKKKLVIDKLTAKLEKLINSGAAKKDVKVLEVELKAKQTDLSETLLSNTKDRIVNMHFLGHRLVAQYFLPKPLPNQKIVSHKDHKKENNKATNLVWMSLAENVKHNFKNPTVVAAKKKLADNPRVGSPNSKLKTAQVVAIKKALAAGKLTHKAIGAKFNISDMQISRINRGENWAHVTI